MGRLVAEISDFLEESGFGCIRSAFRGFDIIGAREGEGREHVILAVDIAAEDASEAARLSDDAWKCVMDIKSGTGCYPIIITEDRWHARNVMMKARLLAHLHVFSPIYARNCEVRRIDRNVAREFLESWHSYGFSSCRHCYGLFFKRHTGHNSRIEPAKSEGALQPGTLVAVGTFSNARRWKKGEREIRSYEWTRYASLPSLRISGGMGKVMKAFIKDVDPDDIMSYADLEWSEGDVYEQLGFVLESMKAPVFFNVDMKDWSRKAVRPEDGEAAGKGAVNFRNFGSAKFRMKLTCYE